VVKAYGVQARTASHPAAEKEEESNNNEGLALERDSLEEIVRYTETLHHHYQQSESKLVVKIRSLFMPLSR
jgi:hypothetical protein